MAYMLKCKLVSIEAPGRLGLLACFGTHSQLHLERMFMSPLCIAELPCPALSVLCRSHLFHRGAIWQQSVLYSESSRAAQALQTLARFGSVGKVSLQSAGCDALCPAQYQTHERLLAQVTFTLELHLSRMLHPYEIGPVMSSATMPAVSSDMSS